MGLGSQVHAAVDKVILIFNFLIFFDCVKLFDIFASNKGSCTMVIWCKRLLSLACTTRRFYKVSLITHQRHFS